MVDVFKMEIYKVVLLFKHSRFYQVGHFFFFYFDVLGPHLQPIEVPRLGVESERQLLAYTVATATPDASHVCNLHHSSWQHQIHNPLSETRDQTCVFMMLVRFVFAEPGWELQVGHFLLSPLTQKITFDKNTVTKRTGEDMKTDERCQP